MSLSTNIILLKIAQERNEFRSFPFVVVFVFIMHPQGCRRHLFYNDRRLTRKSPVSGFCLQAFADYVRARVHRKVFCTQQTSGRSRAGKRGEKQRQTRRSSGPVRYSRIRKIHHLPGNRTDV